MKSRIDEALAIVREALADSGTASWDAPGVIRIAVAGASRLDLRLVFPDESEVSLDEPGETLLLLRRPTKRDLRDLRSKGLSYVGLNGVVRIQGPGLLIDRTDLKVTTTPTRPVRRSAFSDRASLITRWLFAQPLGSESRISGLAEAAGVSPSVASYAAKDLERRGLVEVAARGRERWIRLVEHRRLLTQWAAEYSWRDNTSLAVHAPIGSPRRFLARMPLPLLPRCAVTLQAGASLVLPHAPVEQIHMYIDVPTPADLSHVARKLEWPPDPGGQLLFFMPYYRRSVWDGVREREGVPVVSDLQLMLDLWNHPIRGREQAELLLEKHLAKVSAT